MSGNGKFDPKKWAVADGISDRLVDMLNAELDRMRAAKNVQPLQIFAGMMMGMLAYMRTAPVRPMPSDFRLLEKLLVKLLHDIMHAE